MTVFGNGGWNEGYALGYAQGYAQAIKQVHMKTTLSNMQAMMQNTGWTAEKCMEILNVPLNSRQEYAEKLNHMD